MTTPERDRRARGKRTQAKLLQAGMKVLGDRGYHATRVDDVVRAARTSHGTFYLYFSDKEELIRTLAEQCTAEVMSVVEGLGQVSPGREGQDELRAWLERWNDTYRRYGPVVRAFMEDHVPDPGLARVGARAFSGITKALRARITEAAPANLDPALAAPALLALIERTFYYVLSRQIPVDEDALLDSMAAMIHRGFFAGDPATVTSTSAA